MPVHDYICEPCNIIIPDQYHHSLHAVLHCPDCGGPCEKSWHRDARPLFSPFTVDYGKGPVDVTSLADVRRIEHESERATRNDPKAAPLVFRAFSQDHTNQDVNTLEETGVQQQRPKKKSNVRRSGKPL